MKAKAGLTIFVVFIILVIGAIIYKPATKKNDITDILKMSGFNVTSIVKHDNDIKFNLTIRDKEILKKMIDSGHLLLLKQLPKYVETIIVNSNLNTNIELSHNKNEVLKSITMNVISSNYDKIIDGKVNLHFYINKINPNLLNIDFSNFTIRYNKQKISVNKMSAIYNNVLNTTTFKIKKLKIKNDIDNIILNNVDVTAGQNGKSYVSKGVIGMIKFNKNNLKGVSFTNYINKSYEKKGYLTFTTKLDIDNFKNDIYNILKLHFDFLLSFRDKNSILKMKAKNFEEIKRDKDVILSKSVNLLANSITMKKIIINNKNYENFNILNLTIYAKAYDPHNSKYTDHVELKGTISSKKEDIFKYINNKYNYKLNPVQKDGSMYNVKLNYKGKKVK